LLLGVTLGLPVGAAAQRDVMLEARAECLYRISDVEAAKLTVDRYAKGAFRRWAAVHPAQACPSSLRELDRYTHRDRIDPWGHAYAFTCAAGQLYAMSLGPDGKANTADDIWSHE
jgi:hypothetical protein